MKIAEICLVGFTLLAVAPSPARAEERAAKVEARANFEAGLNQVRQGKFEEAVQSFEDAYRISPKYAVLYNLGHAYAALGRSLEAVRTFERFLLEGGEQIPAERRHAVEAVIAREKARLCRLEFDVSPGDASVLLDDQPFFVGEPEPLQISAGSHTIIAKMAGYTPSTLTITAEPGETVRVSLRLQPEPAVAPVVSPTPIAPLAAIAPLGPRRDRVLLPPEVQHPGADHRRAWALGFGAGAVALSAAAIGTYVWNNGRYDAWARDRDNLDAAPESVRLSAEAQQRDATLTTRAASIQHADDLALGMAVSAGAALVTAGILWLTGAEKAPQVSQVTR